MKGGLASTHKQKWPLLSRDEETTERLIDDVYILVLTDGNEGTNHPVSCTYTQIHPPHAVEGMRAGAAAAIVGRRGVSSGSSSRFGGGGDVVVMHAPPELGARGERPTPLLLLQGEGAAEWGEG